jgi:hypothetical protein
MKQGTVARGPSTDLGTFSTAAFGPLTMDWLELPDRDNAPDISCVPAAAYVLRQVWSNRFNRMVYIFTNVPGRSKIEVHPANWAGDTALGYYSDLEGCSSPGHGVGQIETPHGNMQQAVLHSTAAFNELMAYLAGDDCLLTIIPYNDSAAPLATDNIQA